MPLDVASPPPARLSASDSAPRSRRSGALALGVASLALGGLALYAQLAARGAERRHPPAGKFITVDGVRLHYVERGSGRPVVWLHGMASVLQDFSTSVADDLARDHRVIAFDRPGYGYTERPGRASWTPQHQARLFHMALTRLGIEKPIIVGHSWGALIAVAYALAYPHQTAAIVPIAGYFFPGELPNLAMTSVLRFPLLGAVLRDAIAPFALRLAAQQMLREVFAPNPIPPRFLAEFPAELGYRPSQIRAAAEEMLMLRPAAAALSRRYRDLVVPTVIIAGESDRFADPHRHAIPLHKAVRHSAIRVLPGTGHMVHHARPDAVCEGWRSPAGRSKPPTDGMATGLNQSLGLQRLVSERREPAQAPARRPLRWLRTRSWSPLPRRIPTIPSKICGRPSAKSRRIGSAAWTG